MDLDLGLEYCQDWKIVGLNTARIGGLKILPGFGGGGVKLILAKPAFSDRMLQQPFPYLINTSPCQ